MNPERIQVLLNQGRFEQAEEEIRQNMGQNIENPFAHLLLGYALMGQGKNLETLETAQTAIVLAPDFSPAHALLSEAHYRNGDIKDAKAAVKEAIRLDPDEADHFTQLSSILFYQKRWEEALQAVENALELEPESVSALNIRSRILVKLGRKPEASESFEAAMREDPENTYTHINRGWALLEEARYKEALDHFKEGIRLDPGNEDARSGLVEGLKAKYSIYRGYLKFAFWMNRLGEKMQWAFIIGLIVIVNIIPSLLPFYLAFIFFNWFSGILFNTLLRFNAYGKYALSEREIKYSNIFMGLLIGGITSIIVSLSLGLSFFNVLGLLLLGMLFPVTGTYNQQFEKSQKKSLIYTYIMVGIASAVLITGFMGMMSLSSNLFTAFVLGAVGYTWWVNTLK